MIFMNKPLCILILKFMKKSEGNFNSNNKLGGILKKIKNVYILNMEKADRNH